MITYPIAKINLGLNVVARRPDGYHDLETVFYPVPIRDALELHPMDDGFPSPYGCDLKVTNLEIEGDERRNLVVRAYDLLARDFPLPRLHAHLYKAIPMQAGMGGGSSDCAAMLCSVNELCGLGLTQQQLVDYAARLGADCAFFVAGRPAYAEGIGERLSPIDLDLGGWWLAVVKPPVAVSTKEAFALVAPRPTRKKCREVVMQPVDTWREELTNDFEASVFAQHPEIGQVKDALYGLGAAYAAMSGSGSAVFGLFKAQPSLAGRFDGMFVHVCQL